MFIAKIDYSERTLARTQIRMHARKDVRLPHAKKSFASLFSSFIYVVQLKYVFLLPCHRFKRKTTFGINCHYQYVNTTEKSELSTGC